MNEKADIGRYLLKKSGGVKGWQEGEGLGAFAQGLTEPLQPQRRLGNTGIGFEMPPKRENAAVNEGETQSKKKKANEQPTRMGDDAPNLFHAAIGRMLSAAFNDEGDIPRPQTEKSQEKSSRISRTNLLL